MLKVEVGRFYMNQETGERHKVVGTATHTETNERLVLHDAWDNPIMTWAEPICCFFGTINIKDYHGPKYKLEEL